MSYALFDEAGKFLAGRVMSETESAVQLELDSGKRVKAKATSVLLRFDKPAPAELLQGAQALAQEIDLDLAWEFAPAEEFGFAELAAEYFSAAASAEQQAATLLRLFEAPHYFRRAGKGRFRKASEETVRAALLGIERKRQVAAQIDAWADQIAQGQCPPPVREQLYRILFRPDKNGAEYKAVVEAARRTQRSPLELLQAAGAIDSPYQFHWKRFLFEQFPHGIGFPPLPAPEIGAELPRASVEAFSIDDSHTIEIDDALSVQGLGSGRVTLGVHIAAPGLAIAPDSALDKVARARMSTVYMPGGKITMLPDEVVQRYTLIEGRDCPAVSIYFDIDEATLEVRGHRTQLERVPIATNLRHDLLDDAITEATLGGQEEARYPHAAELAFTWRLAKALKARREAVRGRPETFTRPDYSFALEPDSGAPTGEERVHISTRRRGAPLDLIVSEAMILANSTWGGWLADIGLPAIYRSQASLLPGVKVRMGTKPLPHAGMGVAQYTWATSPLRRYADLVNQWQIIACARHGHTAALAAAFKPRDAALFSIVSGFDAAYAAYGDFQHAIERYWTLRWIEQNECRELDAAVMKEGLVRAESLPLVFRVPGTEGFERGTHVRARIVGIDLLTLDLHAQLLQRLDEPGRRGGVEGADGVIDEADDDAEQSGPLTLAIDLAEPPQDAAQASGAIASDLVAPPGGSAVP